MHENRHEKENQDGKAGYKAYPPVSAKEKILVGRFKEGDTEAFRTIYMRWYDPICFLLKRITRSELDAEDLAQDVFGTLWLQRGDVDPDRDIRAYIFTLARRAASKHIRRHIVKNNYLSSVVHTDESAASNEDIEAREIRLLTDIYISRMPAQRRQAYLLSLDEGLDPAQIAERLNISPKSARNHIYQARRELKEMLTYAVILFGGLDILMHDLDKILPL